MTRSKDFGDPPGQPDGAGVTERPFYPERRASRFSIQPLFSREFAESAPRLTASLLQDHFLDLSVQLRDYLGQLGVNYYSGGLLSQLGMATQEWVKSQMRFDSRYNPTAGEGSRDALIEEERKYKEAVARVKEELPRDFIDNPDLRVRRKTLLIGKVFDDYAYIEYASWKTAALISKSGGAALAIEEFGIPKVPYYNRVPIYDLFTASIHTDDNPLF